MTIQILPLTAHTIQLTVLAFLIDQADRGESELLTTLDPEDLNQLSHLSIRDFLRLTDQRQPILSVHLDRTQLHHSLRRLRHHDDGESDKLWFIARGAPQVLMTELYGMDLREFRNLRRIADLPTRPGRPARLSPECAQAVVANWRQLHSGLPLIERYKRISEQFPDAGIASLYAALHEIPA